MTTDTPRTILPPGSTALERAVDQCAPRWAALLGPHTGGVLGQPAAFTPWLAAEWGLSGFAAYFGHDAHALIAAGLPWLREHGSPAAVRRVLAWLGYPRVRLLEDGPWLHLDPGRRIDPADLLAIAHLVRASIPAHVHFYRVFHGLDGRAIRFDGGPTLDNGLLDNDTGAPIDVDPWGEPIKLSQGLVNVRGTTAPAHARLACVHLLRVVTRRRRTDHLTLDNWRTDSPVATPPRRIGRFWQLHLAPAWQPAGAPARRTRELHSVEAPALLGAPRRAPIAAAVRSCEPITPAPRAWVGRWDAQRWRTTVPHAITQEP